MSEEKRDYAADLAVCEAATPGPVRWQKFGTSYYLTGQYGMRPIIFSIIGVEKKGYEEINISNRDAKRDVLIPLSPEHPDSIFVETAWEALLWYIRKTMEVEAENASLRARLAEAEAEIEAWEKLCVGYMAERDAAEAREGALREAARPALTELHSLIRQINAGEITKASKAPHNGSVCRARNALDKALSTPAPVNLEAMRRVVEAAKIYHKQENPNRGKLMAIGKCKSCGCEMPSISDDYCGVCVWDILHEALADLEGGGESELHNP